MYVDKVDYVIGSIFKIVGRLGTTGFTKVQTMYCIHMNRVIYNIQ